MDKYVTPKKASQLLKVCQQTLKSYERKKLIETIRTPGGRRMYNVQKYLEDNNIILKKETIKKIKICYCRVSSYSQKDDLERQIIYMKKEYPEHMLIKDIGSGLNFKRKGLKKIIKYAIEGKIDEVVIAYKDRLSRFGYDLIESIITDYSKGKIIVLKSCFESPQEELTKDLVSIINVFSAKLNGMRKYNVITKI